MVACQISVWVVLEGRERERENKIEMFLLPLLHIQEKKKNIVVRNGTISSPSSSFLMNSA
jgi:hypothetical protein